MENLRPSKLCDRCKYKYSYCDCRNSIHFDDLPPHLKIKNQICTVCGELIFNRNCLETCIYMANVSSIITCSCAEVMFPIQDLDRTVTEYSGDEYGYDAYVEREFTDYARIQRLNAEPSVEIEENHETIIENSSAASEETTHCNNAIYYYYAHSRREIVNHIRTKSLLMKLKTPTTGRQSFYFLHFQLHKDVRELMQETKFTTDPLTIPIEKTQDYEAGYAITRKEFFNIILFTPVDITLFLARGNDPVLRTVNNLEWHRFHEKFLKSLKGGDEKATVHNLKITKGDSFLHARYGKPTKVTLRTLVNEFVMLKYDMMFIKI